jgi:N-terminal half of MaoC dehydratase
VADDNPVTVPVEPAQVMLFLRAIGADVNLEAGGAGLPVPPTFLQSVQHFIPDYELRPKPGQAWVGSAREPSGVRAERNEFNTLHAEQHYEFRREVRAGDVLSASTRPGSTWEKAGRSGPMRFFERITEFTDQDRNLVATARLVGVEVRNGG